MKPKPRRPSSIERKFLLYWTACRGPQLAQEYSFHPRRKWRFDFAHLTSMIALELQGGVWITGGHSTGSGISRDAEKFTEASLLGWTVIPLTPDLITIPNIERLIGFVHSRSPAEKTTYPKTT